MAARAGRPRRSVIRRLFDLAWPVIGLNVLNVLALAVDTAMCGRLEDSETALSALGYATQIVFLLMVAMMGLTVGTVSLVSRAHGARKRDRVDHILLQSTQLTVFIGVGVGILGNLFADDILRLLGATAEVRVEGVAYLRPLMAGATFYYLNILYGAVLRGVGSTRLPLLIALGSNAVNVVLNYGFILGNLGLPALGVRGAALGTLGAYAFGSITMMWILSRGALPHLRLSLRPRAIDGPLARELFGIGLPAALDMVILNAAFLSIVGMLGRIQEVAVAAHGIGLRVQALAFVPGLSVAQATGAMVGNALGGRDVAEARSIVRASMILSSAIMTTLAILIVAGAHPIVQHVFDVPAGTDLETLSVLWMELLGFGMPIVGMHITFSGMLQGAGSTWFSLGINVISTILIQIPLSWALGFPLGLGAFGVWVAFPLSFVAKVALGFLVYRSSVWTRVGIHAS